MPSENEKQKMKDLLYGFEKQGVPRTHLECLMWFYENQNKIVNNDTLRGKQVEGKTEKGYPYSARRPIPPNDIVHNHHYLHTGVRGWYKPKGEKIISYDNQKREPIWEGENKFVQSLQTGTGESLEGYGKEIEIDGNGNWIKINYNHNSESNYYEITGGYIGRCYGHKLPIGIIFKQESGKNKIMGLGWITNVSEDKLDYTIEPYPARINKMNSQFQFIKKDFNCQKTKDDAQYRWERFRDLYDAVAPQLGSRFDVAKNDIGLKAETSKRKSSYFGRYWMRGEEVYFNYTWLGIMLAEPELNTSKAKKDFQFPSRDTVQFQIGINPKDPLWAGIYIGRDSQNKKTRERMLSLLKNEPEECIKRFKDLSEYVIKCEIDTDDNDTKVIGEWKTSEMDKDIIAEIFKTYSQKDVDFYVCKIFTKAEALES